MRNQITPRLYTRIYFLLVVPFAIIIEVAIMLGTAWYEGASLVDALEPLLEWIVVSLGISLIVYCVFYGVLFVIPHAHQTESEGQS